MSCTVFERQSRATGCLVRRVVACMVCTALLFGVSGEVRAQSIEAFFGPLSLGQRDDVPRELGRFIDGATDSLVVATDGLDHPALVGKLIAAHRRLKSHGTARMPAVRIIVDEDALKRSAGKSGRAAFARLLAAGVAVRTDYNASRMRVNMLVRDADGERNFAKPAVWFGSAGLTTKALLQQPNDGMRIENSEAATVARAKFDDMWTGRFGRQARITRRQSGETTGYARMNYFDAGFAMRLAFTPQENAVTLTAPLIENAERLWFVVDGMRLVSRMTRAVTRALEPIVVYEGDVSGIDPRQFGVLAGLADPPAKSRHPFGRLGFPLHWEGDDTTITSRFFVIDRELLIWSSAPVWRTNASDWDAAVLVIQNFDIAEAYISYFDRLYARGENLAE